MQDRTAAAARTASASGESRGAVCVRAAGAENLQVDVRMPRVDRGDHRHGFVGGHMRSRIGGERRQAHGRLPRRERDAARGRDANAQAREAARPRRHHHPVDIAESHAGILHQPHEQRHQRFGVAARHRQALARHDAAVIGIEHGRRAGGERRIDGEHTHRQSPGPVRQRTPRRAAEGLDAPAHIGRTSTTSGTK